MATLLILINLIISTVFGGNATVNYTSSSTASISGTSSYGKTGSISISRGKINPIILEGEY